MDDIKTNNRISLPLFTTEQKRDVEKLNREILEIELSESRVEFASRPHEAHIQFSNCLLYTSPSPRDRQKSRMPSSA